MPDDRGKLARKIQEWQRESEALSKQPTDPISKAQGEEEDRQTWLRVPVALIWTVAVVVGVATGSVPLAIAAMLMGVLLLQVFVFVKRATA